MAGMAEIKHGTPWGYKQGCREKCCRTALREYNEHRRAERYKIAKEHPERIPHGLTGYTGWGCRCEVCTEGNRENKARVFERNQRLARERPDLVPHGLNGYKNWGCRCHVCYGANREVSRDYETNRRVRKNGGVV